jgi:ubiquinone/menaquinone biosynthesis C-methylase UbiE
VTPPYSPTTPPAGMAFESIAEQYDALFTRSLIGRAQRDAVWNVLRQTFRHGERVLEVNCGTGEDAVFMAQRGISVVACDASPGMISVAARRLAVEAPQAQVRLQVLPTEGIGVLQEAESFDGVFSNFSGLNCLKDLAAFAREIAVLVKPGGKLLLCLSGRVCLWETLWYLGVGDTKRAFRRWTGRAVASLGNVAVEVWYPTTRDITQRFHPWFALRSRRGIGVTVPPSYLEHLAQRHPELLKKLQTVDQVIAGWPVCRVSGDHVLLTLERAKV